MGTTYKGFNVTDFKSPLCANCGHYFWYGEMVFHSKHGYRHFVCQKCSERETMVQTKQLKITAEVNGKQVPLENISTETFEAIKVLEKPKEIPVARIGNYPGYPSNRRLILKITNSIRKYITEHKGVSVIAIDLEIGNVKHWGAMEMYENIKPL